MKVISSACGTHTNRNIDMSSPRDLSRRHFLLASGGAAGLALLLEACTNAPATPKPANGTPAQNGAGNPLPSYIPSAGGPKPDLHATEPRITDGFLNYPDAEVLDRRRPRQRRHRQRVDGGVLPGAHGARSERDLESRRAGAQQHGQHDHRP